MPIRDVARVRSRFSPSRPGRFAAPSGGLDRLKWDRKGLAMAEWQGLPFGVI